MLEILDLSNNTLSGPIPSGIQVLTRLSTLNLANNKFNGSIPSSIGHLTSLVVLDLQGNQLESIVPDSFTKLVRLKELNLNENKLEGVLPDIKSLESFDISDNNGLRVIVPDTPTCTDMDCSTTGVDSDITSKKQTVGDDIPFIISLAALGVAIILILLAVAFFLKRRHTRVKGVGFM